MFKMDLRLVKPEEFNQVYRLRDYAFRKKYEGKELTDFKYWVSNSSVIGCFTSKNQLMGQTMIFPLNMMLWDKNISMGGIGFVASYPEYRNQGVMKQILTKVLLTMREQNQLVSVLGPFSVSFYRHYGWELFFDKISYSLSQIDFPKFEVQKNYQIDRYDLAEMIQRPELLNKVNEFYNTHAKQTPGLMLRFPNWWKRLWAVTERSSIVLFHEDDRLVGFVRYDLQQSGEYGVYIRDLIANDFDCQKSIWNYLASHQSNFFEIYGETFIGDAFDLEFENPQFNKQLEQTIMFRIVDVEAFLKYINFNQYVHGSLGLIVEDQFALWNNKRFEINGTTIVAGNDLSDFAEALRLPINLVSALFSGYLGLTDCLNITGQQLPATVIKSWNQALLILKKPQFYEPF